MFAIATAHVRRRKMDDAGWSMDDENYDNAKSYPLGSGSDSRPDARIAAKVGKKTNVAKCSFRNYL